MVIATDNQEITPGFEPKEAKLLIAICARLDDEPLHEDPCSFLPLPDIPENWECKYTSKAKNSVTANIWELWHNNNSPKQYAIAFRGTVLDPPTSSLENLLGFMISAHLTMTLKRKKQTIPLKFAKHPRAGIHFGFTVGLLTMLQDVVEKINKCWEEGGREFFITGHSQGAAIATLFRSFLEYDTGMVKVDSEKVNYKTYVFAQPKPGNDYYGYDFERITSNTGMGFRITNTLDYAPQVMFTIQTLNDIQFMRPPKIQKLIEYRDQINLRQRLVKYRSRKRERWREKFVDLREEFVDRLEEFNLLEYPTFDSSLVEVLKNLRSKKKQALEQLLQKQKLELEYRYLPTLNYIGCGAPIILEGFYGSEPWDRRDLLLFWHHFGAMYYKLLNKYWTLDKKETG